VPDAHTEPYFVGDSGLLEIPPSVVRLLGRNVPAAGGGYFRLQKQAQAPCVFYFHPWEMDPEQPRIDGIPAKAKFRHYLNLDKFDSRLIALLNQYRWGRMDEIYLGEASS
jgi:hypothetical protein